MSVLFLMIYGALRVLATLENPAPSQTLDMSSNTCSFSHKILLTIFNTLLRMGSAIQEGHIFPGSACLFAQV